MQECPLYDLDQVREAGATGKVVLSRNAQRDYQEMGYELADVHQCIASLQLSDYRGVREYNDVEYDVYHARYRGPTGHHDELYVKLRAPAQATVAQVALTSFHLHR